MDDIPFDSFRASLGNTPAEAAETDGTLCGVCAVHPGANANWGHDVFGRGAENGEVAEDVLELIVARGGQIVAALHAGELAFQPLLPGDDEPLELRIAALAAWCQGFLAGLSLAGADTSQLPGDAAEALRDLGRVTQAGLDDNGATDSEESAYTEIVEYVRVAIQIVFYELARLDRVANGDTKQ